MVLSLSSILYSIPSFAISLICHRSLISFPQAFHGGWNDKDYNGWKNRSVFLGQNKEIIDAELWAIALGLEIAGKITLNSNQTPTTIFSDSREALTTLCQLSSRTQTPYLRNLIFQKASDMESKGHSVTIRWTPSHAELVCCKV